MIETSHIKLTNVTTTYDGESNPTIHDINLTIKHGEFVIVGGPNGSGKTTLLETISGLLPHSSGSIEIDGEEMKKHISKIRKKIGYVIQKFDFDAFTPFKVEEVILMARYSQIGIMKHPRSSDYKAVDEAISLLKIENIRKSYIGKISGGQQQKVLIAHNLAKKPDILLLDEPFSNLDFVSREQVCNILSNLTEFGITIVIVSHAFDALPDRDIRVVVMKQGRIIYNRILSSSSVINIVKDISIEDNYD